MVYGADPNEGGSDMDKETRIRKRNTRLEVLTVALVLVLGSLTASAVTLDVVAPAAHCGVFGLKVSFSDTSPGYVQDNNAPGTKIIRAVRDIRKAIDIDSRLGTAGALGAIAVAVTIEEPPETDNGYLSLEGFGFFDQRIRTRADGDYGEL